MKTKEENITIRLGQITDTMGIAKVNVNCWRSTYQGIIPDEILKSKTYKTCEEGWIKYFENRDSVSSMLVAADKANKIIGFCTGGLNRDIRWKEKFSGELIAIYIEEQHQNAGIGKKLTVKFVQNLLERGINSMIVCVLEKNNARGFYEKLGGLQISEKTYSFGGKTLNGIVYGWDDLKKFF